MSSQNAARNGFVCDAVGRHVLLGVLLPPAALLPPNSSQPFVEIATWLYATPSIVMLNGIVAVCTTSSPLNCCRPGMLPTLMSSGLNASTPWGDIATAFGWIDQPSFVSSLSSRIFPLQVSGYAFDEPPPAPWKPIVAAWPFAFDCLSR